MSSYIIFTSQISSWFSFDLVLIDSIVHIVSSLQKTCKSLIYDRNCSLHSSSLFMRSFDLFSKDFPSSFIWSQFDTLMLLESRLVFLSVFSCFFRSINFNILSLSLLLHARDFFLAFTTCSSVIISEFNNSRFSRQLNNTRRSACPHPSPL